MVFNLQHQKGMSNCHPNLTFRETENLGNLPTELPSILLVIEENRPKSNRSSEVWFEYKNNHMSSWQSFLHLFSSRCCCHLRIFHCTLQPVFIVSDLQALCRAQRCADETPMTHISGKEAPFTPTLKREREVTGGTAEIFPGLHSPFADYLT